MTIAIDQAATDRSPAITGEASRGIATFELERRSSAGRSGADDMYFFDARASVCCSARSGHGSPEQLSI
jgi:hypothetical protein